MSIIICHGAYGDPHDNWIPWLKQELEKLGQDVHTPKFPTPQGQNLDNWMKVLNGYNRFDSNLIIIGHSIAPAMILEKLEQIDIKIKAAIFVTPFVSKIGKPEFDEINRTFYKEHNYSKIENNCRKFIVFQSDNDPYVPMYLSEDVAEMLRTEPITVHKAGHFNEVAGYTKFPQLLEEIKKLL